MTTVRRWYIYLVSAISLQAVAWAAIALLRSLLTPGLSIPKTAIAFQIAVIVIGLPLFLVHWLWAQRLAGRETDERESLLRRLYLYGTMAGFLGPFAANAFGLIAALLRLVFGTTPTSTTPTRGYATFPLSPTEAIIYHLVALAVVGLLWFYHRRIATEDARAVPETGGAATVHRLYILGFSAAGLTMTALAVIQLLRWIMLQFGDSAAIGDPGYVGLANEVVRLVVGVPLWLIFWNRAQRMFAGPAGPAGEERASALRKLYLYLAVFIAVLTTVTSATFILAGFFRRILDLPSMGDVRQPLPIIIGMAVLWAYHAAVLRGDAALAGEAPRQAGVRRLYLYLVAGVGLAAFLVGLSGDVSVLIRFLSGTPFISDLREQLAWFTAALIAGLPVWILPWRGAQLGAVAAGPAGADERRSVVRKIYLYFYLFVATMTVLSSAVYIVSQLVGLALGARVSGNLLSDLAQAVAYTLIAVGVWLYHGSILREDGRLSRTDRAERLEGMRIAVVDGGEGHVGRALLEGLRHELPGLSLDPIGLTRQAAEAMGAAQGDAAARLSGAGLIVGPWTVARVSARVEGAAGGAEIAGALVASPARKLLAPVRDEGWEWAGVDRWETDALVRQTVRAVRQMAAGEEVKPVRPLGAGAIIAIVIGVLFLLILLAIPVLEFFAF